MATHASKKGSEKGVLDSEKGFAEGSQKGSSKVPSTGFLKGRRVLRRGSQNGLFNDLKKKWRVTQK